jgi:hypothetical protein
MSDSCREPERPTSQCRDRLRTAASQLAVIKQSCDQMYILEKKYFCLQLIKFKPLNDGGSTKVTAAA